MCRDGIPVHPVPWGSDDTHPSREDGMQYRMMRLPEVEAATGLSATTIWRYERDGEFPRRRRIGPNAVAWRSDEIEAWIESRPAVHVGDGDAAA